MRGAATVSARSDLGAALARASVAVDDRFGIVRQVALHEIGPSDPPFFFATAQLASTHPFSDAVASALNGGAGTTSESALLGALGEAVERYAIGCYREEDTFRASFREVERVALDPSRLIFFADEQYSWERFPYVRFNAEAPLSWVTGVSLADGSEKLVPAARVFTPYVAPGPAERLLQSTSTGAACHVEKAQATLLGLYECIERDAVMIAWLNRLRLPVVDPDGFEDAELAAAVERCRVVDLDVRLLDATMDVGVPTVLAVLVGPLGIVPSVAVGAATRPTMVEAARKALVESAHTFFWIHTRCRVSDLPRFRSDYADVVSLDQHSLLYGDPRMRAKLGFLIDPAERVAPVRGPMRARHVEEVAGSDEMARCREALRRLELEAVVVDVTPRDVADLGLAVVRVVVVDLHPLWGGHHVRCLGGERVGDVHVRLGYLPRSLNPAELNADPHPLP
jgi:ribosomal protein S12 methylthiotransferase accessory factor